MSNSFEFEHTVSKFELLMTNAVVMSAGSATVKNDIIAEARMLLAERPEQTFYDATIALKEAYAKVRITRAEELHLKPKKLDFDLFYRNQKLFPSEAISKMLRDIEGTNLKVDLILCGFDMNGGHIISIADPGTSECFDSVGFFMVGTGSAYALRVFSEYNYTQSLSLEDALFLTYLAKREAECAQGVGTDTDIAIVSPADGIKLLKVTDGPDGQISCHPSRVSTTQPLRARIP